MKPQGIIAGLILSVLIVVPSIQSKAEIVDASILRSALVKVGVVASAIVGNPYGAASVVADFFTLNFNLGTIVPDTTETITTSFTRATPSSVTTVDGREGVQIGSGEVPFHGLDRIENLLRESGTPSEDLNSTDWTHVVIGDGAITYNPDGSVTVETTSSGRAYIQKNALYTSKANREYTVSFIVSDLTGTTAANIAALSGGTTYSLAGSSLAEGRLSYTFTQSSDSTKNALFGIGTNTTNGSAVRFTISDIQVEDVTGKPNKAPGQYTSVGVGVQPDILTSAITASDWVAQGSNTVADNGDGSVKITYVDSDQAARWDIGAAFPQINADTTSRWVLQWRAKVNTGSVNVAWFDESPTVAETLTSTSYVTYNTYFGYDGSGSVTFAFNAMSTGEEIDIEILSIRKADHGANIDGVKYFNTWNPRYVDSSNVVQNDSATGAAISSSTASFANLNPVWQDDHYSQGSYSNPSGSFIVGGYVAPANLATGTTQSIISQWLSDKAYILSIDGTGKLQLFLSADGTAQNAYVSSVTLGSLGIVDGQGFHVQARFNASSQEVTYWYSLDSHAATAPTWVQFGGTDATTESSINVSAAAVNVGVFSTNAWDFQGRIYSAYVIDGTDPTAAKDIEFDPNDTTGWTANGNAYIYTPPLNPDGDGPAGLQVAAASTNTQVYSEEADNAAWTKSNFTIAANAATAPDGTLTADRLDVGTGVGVDHYIYDDRAITLLNTDYTASVHLKDDGGRYAVLVIQWAAYDWVNVVADLQTGTITQSGAGTGTSTLSGTSIDRLSDGWVRLSVTGQDSADISPYFNVIGSNTGTFTPSATYGRPPVYTANAGDDLLFWGAQFEQGSLGPYVKTVASSQARNAEVGTYSGLSLTTNSGHITVSDIGAVDGETYVRIDDGTANNYVRAYLNGSAQVQLDVYSGGVAQAQMTSTTTFSAGDDIEIAWRVAEDDMALLINGSQEATDTSGSVPASMDDVDIGHNAGTVAGTRNTGSLQLFDTAKSNAELSAL